MALNARAPVLYFFTPCLGYRIGEGREVHHRCYALQQVSGISWHGRKSIFRYSPITRNKKKRGISDIVDIISNHYCIFFSFLKEQTTQNSRDRKVWQRLICSVTETKFPPFKVLCLAHFILWDREYFLVCVFTESRARAFSSWAPSLAEISIMISEDSFRVDGLKVLDFKEVRS